jgi:hypothetical protein
MHLRATYVKLMIVRKIVSFICLAVAALGCAQFKVDPQKIPVVQRKRRALIIGASSYQHLGKLSFASSDAERFRDALIAGFGFTKDSIKFVSDSPDSPAKPVAATILGELEQMLKDPILDRGDMFILYFSGHGMATPKGDYLCSTDTKPSDIETTGVPVLEVVQKLVKAKLRNVVIIADACRAGEKNEFGSDLYDLAKKSNIAVMLGCSPGQKSYEVPALKSGAFTYFLLKALGNPKNRTESGGLWTSKIATSVENSVFEYTQHDYGDNAQRPRSLADPTSDVMLAKFVTKPEQRSLLSQNEDLKMVTDPEKVSDQMLEIGGELMQSNDYSGSLEACKQALSLNAGNMFAAYYASVSTTFLGRSGEHEKYCDMLKQSPDPYFHNLGFVFSDSRATRIADRAKSLRAFWESSPKDDVNALITWGKAQVFLPDALVKETLRMMQPDLKQGTRLSTLFEGEIAVIDGKLEMGLAKYRAAMKLSESTNYITNEELTVMQFPLLRQLSRLEELKTLMRSQFNQEKVPAMIWVTVAANLKAIGNRDAAIAIVKKGIKEGTLTELEVEICGLVMGASISDIVEDLEAQQKASPYSWKIRTIALIARGIKDKDVNATAKAFDEASRYCDDELEVISLTYQIENALIQDATRNFGISADKFSEPKELFRLMFFNRADQLGTDSEKWHQLGELGLDALQGPNTLRLFKKYLPDFSANSSLGSEFYGMLFQLATSVEDDDLAKYAIDHPKLTEPDRTDFRLLYVVYLITRGHYQKAKETFASIEALSPEFKIISTSVSAIFKARAGDLVPLKEVLGQKLPGTEGNLLATGVAALAMSDLGHDDVAFPGLELVTKLQPTMVASIPMRCAERYFRILKAKGKVDQADQALFEMLKVNQSSPGIRASFFGTKASLQNYVCHLSGTAKWVSDQTFDQRNPTHKDSYMTAAMGQGTVDLAIRKDGSVSGSIQVLDGERFELSGTVDQFGNLRGKAKSKDHEFDLEAKLIGNEFKKTDTFKKSSVGQLIQIFNEKGLITQWFIPESITSP